MKGFKCPRSPSPLDSTHPALVSGVNSLFLLCVQNTGPNFLKEVQAEMQVEMQAGDAISFLGSFSFVSFPIPLLWFEPCPAGLGLSGTE